MATLFSYCTQRNNPSNPNRLPVVNATGFLGVTIKGAEPMKEKTVMELYERSCELQLELEEIQEEIDIRAGRFVQKQREGLYSDLHKKEMELDGLDPASVDYADAFDELRMIQREINDMEAAQ